MRGFRLLLVTPLLFVLGASVSFAQAAPEIVSLRLEGVVDPFQASYLTGAISDAEEEGAAAVLISIDTPGGLDSSMRKIIQSILNSEVPILCYVSPEGARAASAGTFILLSCDIATMAPGTNVGAASPVGVSGVVEQEKALNDAAAYIRSIAEQKDRNPDWAESAVREAASISAEEALRLGVIDSIEPSDAAVLSEYDGATVEKNGQTITVVTSEGELVEVGMGLGSRLLHGLLSPDFAFLFFYLGIALIIVEVLHPGISVPGILGVLSLIAAFAAFGMLPVELLGIVLLLASAGLFLLELKNPGVGVAGISAVVALIAGGLYLFDRSVPGASVSLWMILPVAGIMAAFFALVAPAALRARHLPVVSGLDSFVGREGVVTQDLAPKGVVHVGSELWSAESISGTVSEGQRVRVVAAEGLRLKVEPLKELQQVVKDEPTGGKK